MTTRLALAMPHASQQAPRTPPMAPPPRTSMDFTSQVMARLSSAPPEPDPHERKAAAARARMRRLARWYFALIAVSAVALIALVALVPELLLGVVTALVSLALLAVTLAATVTRLTGGAVTGFDLAYLAMLAALAPPLVLAARRTSHGRSSSSRRS